MKSTLPGEIHARVGLSSPGSRWGIARLLALGAAAALAVTLVPSMTLATTTTVAVVKPHVVVSGDWPQFHNGATREGYNAQEHDINAGNAAALELAWTATTGAANVGSPVVANGVVYVPSLDHNLYAYAVDCAAGGGTCTPLWTADTGSTMYAAPAVADGVVYVGSDDHELYAFDAAGVIGCSGTPKTCLPLWTGATGAGIESSPAVSGGVVYVGSLDHKLYAFDAAGVTGCSGSPVTCLPLWTGATGNMINSAPAVAGGVVYVGSWDHKLYAFDAAGSTGCSGSPVVCTPLWTGATGDKIYSSPAVAGGVVYMGSNDNKLYAFAVGCASGGGTCTPLWTANIGVDIFSSPAVANGVVYVGSNNNYLYAFAVGCASGGGTCTPLWTGVTEGSIYSSPAVANGVVLVGSNGGKLNAFAVGCASGGGTCSPIWTATTGGMVEASPAVVDGVVYVGSDDGGLYAFGLPDVTQLVVSGLPSSYLMGSTQSVTVTAKDAGGDVATWYRGTVHLTSSDPSATLPGDYTFTAGDNGVHVFSVTLTTLGTRSVTATDTVTGSINGSQTGIVVETYAAATYHAIAPARVLDTRPTAGVVVNKGLTGTFVAGTVRTFHVANATYVGGGSAVAVPPGATAVTGNLTITTASAAGLVALGPTMTPTGEVTTINFVRGDTRANNVTLGLAPDGTLGAVFRSSTAGATTHLIFDVTGYFTPDTTGATYHPVTPGRILDTRPTGSGHTNIGLAGRFKSKIVRTFTVAGAAGLGWGSPQVPVGATAVTGNVTVVGPTTLGFVSLGPTLPSVPSTSTVNLVKGGTTANGVTVALNGNTLQAVYVGTAATATADVILDVTGYFTADASGLKYHPIVPARYLDSSTGKGLSGLFVSPTPRTLAIGGVGAVPIDAAGISGNLTLVNPATNGFAQVAPLISGTPTSSTVNAVVGRMIANGFDVPLSGSGQLDLIWYGLGSATAHLQLDVTGYWK